MPHPNPALTLTALLFALLLGACTSQVPLLIRQGPVNSPAPEAMRDQADDYMAQQVRWGGILIATDNRADATWLTILARPLDSDGKPGHGDDSIGRFIAVVPEFLDPQVYAADRLVTVTGTVVRTEPGKVGDHPYSYPVVAAQAWYLWPVATAAYGSRYADYYDGWYDPWFGPWWYGPWHDPWYYHRWYPYNYPFWQMRRHAGQTPVPDTGPPALPEHRHRHVEHHTPPDRAVDDGPRHYDRAADRHRDSPGVPRHPPIQHEAREPRDNRFTRDHERSVDFNREERTLERGFHPRFQMNERGSDRGFRLPFRR